MELCCHSDWHHFAGDRLLAHVGLWWSSHCYQEVWRSGGLCLWRAAEWWTLSCESALHPPCIADIRAVCAENRDKCQWQKSDRKCADQCWICFALVPSLVFSVLVSSKLPPYSINSLVNQISTVVMTTGYLLTDNILQMLFIFLQKCQRLSLLTPIMFKVQEVTLVLKKREQLW